MSELVRLEVSESTWDSLATRLRPAGTPSADLENPVLDMTGIGLIKESPVPPPPPVEPPADPPSQAEGLPGPNGDSPADQPPPESPPAEEPAP